VIGDESGQRSRITSIMLNFGTPIDAAPLSQPNAERLKKLYSDGYLSGFYSPLLLSGPACGFAGRINATPFAGLHHKRGPDFLSQLMCFPPVALKSESTRLSLERHFAR
jgi:hypothetical protein